MLLTHLKSMWCLAELPPSMIPFPKYLYAVYILMKRNEVNWMELQSMVWRNQVVLEAFTSHFTYAYAVSQQDINIIIGRRRIFFKQTVNNTSGDFLFVYIWLVVWRWCWLTLCQSSSWLHVLAILFD